MGGGPPNDRYLGWRRVGLGARPVEPWSYLGGRMARMLRWLTVPTVLGALLLWSMAKPPDVVITADAKLVWGSLCRRNLGALNTATWRLRARRVAVSMGAGLCDNVSGRGCKGTAADAVRTSYIILGVATRWKRSDSDKRQVACGVTLGCVVTHGDVNIALIRDPESLADDCGHATVILATIPLRRDCPAVGVVIDLNDLRQLGAHALWIDTDGVRVQSVHDYRGARPVPVSTLSAHKSVGRNYDKIASGIISDLCCLLYSFTRWAEGCCEAAVRSGGWPEFACPL